MSWAEIDPTDSDLTPREAIALQQMVANREQYVYQGRTREAHGMGTAILIFWRVIHRFPDDGFSNTIPTGYGDLK